MATMNVDEEITLNLIRMQLINERKSRHLSQRDVADATGLSLACISNIENTTRDEAPNFKSLVKYLGAMGLELYVRPIDQSHTNQPPIETANVVQAKPIQQNKEVQS